MGYKRFDELSFAASSSTPSWRDSIPEGRVPARRDLAVEGILRHSRSYKMMEKIDRVYDLESGTRNGD